MAQRYAPDTNFLLHFKSAADLPWAEITQAKAIELILLDEVLREIDKHKNDSKGRRSKRARKVVEQIRPLVAGEQDEIEVRATAPRVVLRLAPLLPVTREKPIAFDYSKGDARIAEEALACAQEMGDDEFTLLADDTLAVRLARTVGLKSLLAPENWRLAPETDERDKQIYQLKENLRAWESQAPRIALAVLQGGTSVDVVGGTFVHYPPLSEGFLDRAMEAVCRKYPRDDGTEVGKITAIIEDDRAKYLQARAEWEAQIRERLERCALILNAKVELLPVAVVLKNEGSASADHLIVDINAEGSIRLVDMEKNEEIFGKLGHNLKTPPPFMRQFVMERIYSYPQTLGVDAMMRGLDNHRLLKGIRGVPGRGFQWSFDDPGIASVHCRGECGEFRHMIDREELALNLRTVPGEPGKHVGSLKIRYSAKNLIESTERVWRVVFECIEADTESTVAAILLQELQVDLQMDATDP